MGAVKFRTTMQTKCGYNGTQMHAKLYGTLNAAYSVYLNSSAHNPNVPVPECLLRKERAFKRYMASQIGCLPLTNAFLKGHTTTFFFNNNISS